MKNVNKMAEPYIITPKKELTTGLNRSKMVTVNKERNIKMTNTQKLIKADKEKNINLMSTSSILWLVFKRHYTFIVTVAFVLSWVYMFIKVTLGK